MIKVIEQVAFSTFLLLLRFFKYSGNIYGNFRGTDIKEIAEVFVDKQHAGKTIKEIEDIDNATIYLILRDDLSILPQRDTVLKQGDIIVIKTSS